MTALRAGAHGGSLNVSSYSLKFKQGWENRLSVSDASSDSSESAGYFCFGHLIVCVLLPSGPASLSVFPSSPVHLAGGLYFSNDYKFVLADVCWGGWETCTYLLWVSKCCWISGLILKEEVGTRRSREATLCTVAMWETYISSAFFWPLKASWLLLFVVDGAKPEGTS